MISPPASPFVHARWIWPERTYWDLHNCYALFRKIVDLPRLPSTAPLFITADQAYILFVNGRLVCRGPARGFQRSWPYDEVDVRPWLKSGRNILAVRAYNPGRSSFQYITQGFAGLLVAARWGTVKIHSDNSWKCLRQPGIFRDTVPVSMQLFDQEHVDLRQEPAKWTDLRFDDRKWLVPESIPWNSEPWTQLEPRGMPLLKEETIRPAALLGEKAGTSASGYEQVRDVIALRDREDRSHQPARTKKLTTLAVPATRKGKFRSHLIDFGKTVVGNLHLIIEGAHGGEIIDTHYAETIDAATLTPHLNTKSYCCMAFGDRLICRRGKNNHRFFHYYGFRYLTLTVRDAPAGLRLKINLDWVGYPLEPRGSFTSSDRELQHIWETCAWTQQCCSLDAYVDTPWREQAQWWGDARVQGWNTFHLSGDARLFRRGIKQIAAQTTPDGVTYGHAPTMAHLCVLPDFTLIWMLTLWDYYWQTESIEPFLAHQATLQRALDYFRRHTDPVSGLITCDNRYWLFLDWTDIFKDGAPALYNLWLLLALEKLAQLYRLARQPRQAAPLEAWAKKLRAALARLVDKTGLIRDGLTRTRAAVKETSPHSQTLALLANIPGLNAQKAAGIALRFIRGETTPKAIPSAYWVTYVFSMLTDLGHETEVLAFIKKRWLPMAGHGTTFEGYEVVPGDSSASHAWSAHPLFHLMQTIGGIKQAAPGWRKIQFKPTFHGTHATTVIPTPHGLIRSSWKKSKGKATVRLQLPQGIKAHIHLPGIRSRIITGSTTWNCGPFSQSC